MCVFVSMSVCFPYFDVVTVAWVKTCKKFLAEVVFKGKRSHL